MDGASARRSTSMTATRWATTTPGSIRTRATSRPGVLMIAKLVQAAIATGRRRLDFLRGDESYKYEWGAVDEPIERILVTRTGAPAEGRPDDDDPHRRRSLLEAGPPARAAGLAADPRARDPGDRHERRRPGAPVRSPRADGPRALRRQRRVPLERQRRPQARPAWASRSRSSTSPTTTSRSSSWPSTWRCSRRRSSTSTCTGPRWSARARSGVWSSSAIRGPTSSRRSTPRASAPARTASCCASSRRRWTG